MSSFHLKLNFQMIGSMSINNDQGWLVHIVDGDIADAFFDWLNGKKYHPEASIEYSSDNVSTSDFLLIHKYIKTLRFRLSDNESNYFYYQQRYHATENDNVDTLNHYLGSITDPFFKQLAHRLGLNKLLNEKINMLSSGEFRKAIILKASMSKPFIMFIEDPYSGIDSASCAFLDQLFSHLIQNGTSVVIFTSTNRRPGFINYCLNIGETGKDSSSYDVKYIKVPEANFNTEFNSAFKLKNISADYNGRSVLHNVSWEVTAYQKWSLTGHNGAGKSTLLSFVNADNPQVYSNNVYLFDKKRGMGESIWEIKDRIGFYSAEMHRYFNKLQTVESAINSIVFQNPYSKRVLNSSEENFKFQLLTYYKLEGLEQKLLCDQSVITQKLVMIIAVLLKNAPLLILDEPFQGFGDQLIKKSTALLNKYVGNRTFIMVSHNVNDFPECITNHFYLKNGRGGEVGELVDISHY